MRMGAISEAKDTSLVICTIDASTRLSGHTRPLHLSLLCFNHPTVDPPSTVVNPRVYPCSSFTISIQSNDQTTQEEWEQSSHLLFNFFEVVTTVGIRIGLRNILLPYIIHFGQSRSPTIIPYVLSMESVDHLSKFVLSWIQRLAFFRQCPE